MKNIKKNAKIFLSRSQQYVATSSFLLIDIFFLSLLKEINPLFSMKDK